MSALYLIGAYMARIYMGQPAVLNTAGAPVERLLYRISGIDEKHEIRWTRYALAALAFNLPGLLPVYALQRLQAVLPFNPQALPAISPDSAFNTAVNSNEAKQEMLKVSAATVSTHAR